MLRMFEARAYVGVGESPHTMLASRHGLEDLSVVARKRVEYSHAAPGSRILAGGDIVELLDRRRWAVDEGHGIQVSLVCLPRDVVAA